MSAWANTRGRHVLREFIVTICAGDPAVLSSVRLQRVVLKTEKYVGELPVFYFLLFKLTLYLLNYALPPLSWKLRPFTWMNLEERQHYLEEWQASSFYYKRTLFKMVQCVCVSHLYSERKLLESIGFGESLAHREQRSFAGSLPMSEAPSGPGGAP
ncbi:MAG: hypothetical protein HY075_11435 [Deltaproteobacteria bacterium]|nr:hypothetical protein [Deltaproteobacteria bacterium]